METVEVGFIAESDRPALCRMLEESDDFPQEQVSRYRRASSLYWTFTARRVGEIVGMLTGSFDSNLLEVGTFESFDVPPAPHAFLDRIHVRESARRSAVGRALVEAYAMEAVAHGCSFIGGLIDRSSDWTVRSDFFDQIGFSIRDQDILGAHPSQILRAR